MYLSRLTAIGFKSFADRLDLKIQDGLVCVVGPNGCGKSNVVDALKWALGEQRPRLLRSHSMDDVIFSGSRTRKALGMAEVSVTLDNSEDWLPVDYSEVTVTRRLFRSGESEYLLNKVPCRLKDIHNLLMDTGLGASHAYVIEQGMVDEIISDKPEERRRLFEEAAGVTRYKVRRKSAWNKLQSIQQDLVRLDDIVAEVERQVNHLARQERKARLYKTRSEALGALEILLARFRFFEMSDRARPMLDEMVFLKEDGEIGQADIAKLDARLEAVRAALAEQDHVLAAATSEVSRHQAHIYRKDREVAIARTKTGSIEQFLSRAAKRRSALRALEETAIQAQADAEEEQREALGSLEEAEMALQREEAALETVVEMLETTRSRSDDKKAKLIDALRDLRDQGVLLERARTELEGVTGQRERLGEDRTAVRARLAEAEDRASSAARRIADEERRLGEHNQLRAAHAEAKERLEKDLYDLVEQRNGVRTRMEADAARLALLRKLREGLEGYSAGACALLKDDSPLSGRIRGVVADQIVVEPDHASAVEAALGRAVECLVVDSTNDAVETIAFLRSGKLGAAAFLPLDGEPHDSGFPWEVSEGSGIVGRASDLILSENGEESAVSGLLRRVLVVEDADVAVRLLSEMRSVGVDVVTLKGEVFAANGTVYGGAANGQETGLIGRTRRIERLEADLEAGRKRSQSLEADIKRLEEALQEETRALEVEEGVLGGVRSRLAGLHRDCENALAEVKRQTEIGGELAEEEDRLAERARQLQGGIVVAEQTLKALEEKRRENANEGRKSDEVLRVLEGRRRARSDDVSSRRVEIASLRARVSSLEREAQRQVETRAEWVKERDQLDEERAANEKRRAGLAEVIKEDSKALEGLNQVRITLERERITQAERQQDMATSAREMEADLRRRRASVSERKERLHRFEVELAELKTRAEGLQERIRRDSEVNIQELGRVEDPEFSADVTENEVNEMQERLRRMGSVNLAALDEYDVQRERFEFLSTHRADLREAEQTLKRTIVRLDRTARARFLEAFSKIREQFQQTFAAFFDGGEADILLAPDEDPLEAPMEIVARPGGKRLQNINLLSGGERALTAIAMLFAIYLVKPSPFCILDEVDAPLDDANVDRFVRVVRKFSEQTQFVVVTHNKGTMEAADCLHGITMEEPGVSKLVSVRLEGRETPSGNGHAAGLEEPEIVGVDVG